VSGDDVFLSRGLAATTTHALGLEVMGGDGVWLELADGKRLMDLISGIGVSSFGHGHPHIRAAIHDQVDRHLHAMVYGEFRQAAVERAAERLRALLPEPLDCVYFVNSGAEAIEGALKLAKRTTRRPRIAACTGGYHGNTHGAMSLSTPGPRTDPFRPLLPDVDFIPFNRMDGLDRIDGSQAAVVVETVQGDAGVRIPDSAWLAALRERCTATGTLLVLDEIQCGMGRTGQPWAFNHFGVVPDVLVLGKALGGGMPIGAFVSSTARMAALADGPPLGHITTFGGHPVVCAAAAAALELLRDVNFEEVERRGVRLHAHLAAHPAVREVRRIGMYFAVDFDDAAAAWRCIGAGLEAGVLLFGFLSTPYAVRLAPPLTLTDADLEAALPRLTVALDAAVG
jgi:acetylornithine/succinyldiaminopimelate/putrescine aminotransferase